MTFDFLYYFFVIFLLNDALVFSFTSAFNIAMSLGIITDISVRDIRFPTSKESHGSDAVVSAVY